MTKKLDTDEVRELHEAGNELYGMGCFREAIARYTQAIARDPCLLEVYYNRALAFMNLGENGPACGDLEAALRLNGALPEVHYLYGRARERLGEFGAAASAFLECYHQASLTEDAAWRRKAIEQLEALMRKPGEDRRGRGARPDEEEAALNDFAPCILDDAPSWDDFGGECRAKAALLETARLFAHRDAFEALGGRLPRGILLHGRPGTGKTYLATIFGAACGAAFYSVRLTEILSYWFSHSEKNLERLFRQAAEHEQAVIFLDELDGLATRRGDGPGGDDSRAERRMLSTLLTCMSGADNRYRNVLVIGATNQPQALDPALLRPGRFDMVFEVCAPGAEARAAIFKAHVTRCQRGASKANFARHIDYAALADCTPDFVGDDIRHVVDHALRNRFLAVLETGRPFRPVTTRDLEAEARAFQPRKFGGAATRHIGLSSVSLRRRDGDEPA